MEGLAICVLNLFAVILAGMVTNIRRTQAVGYRWESAEIGTFILAVWSSALSVAWVVRHV